METLTIIFTTVYLLCFIISAFSEKEKTIIRYGFMSILMFFILMAYLITNNQIT